MISILSLKVDPPIDRPEPTKVQWGTVVSGSFELAELLDGAKTLRLELEKVRYTNSPLGEYLVTFSITIPGTEYP